jgi:hypothetical protein
MGTRNWREIRDERALNDVRIESYRRLMDAQERIARALATRGVSDAQIEAALAASEAAEPTDEHTDPYLPMLEAYVTALGGELVPHGTAPPGTTIWKADS